MIKANFSDERNLTQAASRGGQAKQTGEVTTPYYQAVGYEAFCRWLVKRFGADYLRRPDGEPLDFVLDSAFAVPAKTPKPVNPRQLPPDIYTGNPVNDVRLEQKPHPASSGHQTPETRLCVAANGVGRRSPAAYAPG